jgi:drug/metabolite transporter (DMT)-like permease
MILGLFLALGQTICWAGASIVLRQLSSEHDATLLNGLRSLVGLAFVLPLVWITGQQAGFAALDTRSLMFIVGSSLVGGVIGDGLYIAVLDMIGVSRALPIVNSFPIFTLLLSVLLLDEPIVWPMVLGIALVLVGAYLVSRPSKATNDPHAPPPAKRLALGVALAVLIAALWAGAAVAVTMGLKQVTPMAVSSIRLAVIAGVSLAAVGVRGRLGDIARFRGKTLRSLVLASILGSLGSITLFMMALTLAGPSRVTTVNATLPLFGAGLSYLFFRERLSRSMWVGTVLTVVGLILVVI